MDLWGRGCTTVAPASTSKTKGTQCAEVATCIASIWQMRCRSEKNLKFRLQATPCAHDYGKNC